MRLVCGDASEARDALEEFLSTVPWFEDRKVRSDLVFFETPNGGAVFSVGSIGWGHCLADEDFENDVARLTTNVLRRFVDPEPFALPAAEPD